MGITTVATVILGSVAAFSPERWTVHDHIQYAETRGEWLQINQA